MSKTFLKNVRDPRSDLGFLKLWGGEKGKSGDLYDYLHISSSWITKNQLPGLPGSALMIG
jgi:hypothetical protein